LGVGGDAVVAGLGVFGRHKKSPGDRVARG
jgi:hypothetical protein